MLKLINFLNIWPKVHFGLRSSLLFTRRGSIFCSFHSIQSKFCFQWDANAPFKRRNGQIIATARLDDVRANETNEHFFFFRKTTNTTMKQKKNLRFFSNLGASFVFEWRRWVTLPFISDKLRLWSTSTTHQERLQLYVSVSIVELSVEARTPEQLASASWGCAPGHRVNLRDNLPFQLETWRCRDSN